MGGDGSEFRYITPEALIRARLGDGPAPRWAAAVVCFRDAKCSAMLADVLGARPADRRLLYGKDPAAGEVLEAEVAGRRIVVVKRCIWGGPQAAILTEELAALGVPIVVGWGACGGITPALERHENVIADRALATDGTSAAYGSGDLSADAGLVAAARAAGEALGVRPRCVTAATVDALYRETRPAIDAMRDRGADVVNMETSPMYAAARAGGARAVWIGHVSDRLNDDGWEDWYGPWTEAVRRKAEWAAETLRRLVGG